MLSDLLISGLGTVRFRCLCAPGWRADQLLARNLLSALSNGAVETAEQVDLLRGMGCKLAQGYLFGRPTPASQVPHVLSTVTSSADETEALVPMSLELSAHQLSDACDSDAAIAFMDPTGTRRRIEHGL